MTTLIQDVNSSEQAKYDYMADILDSWPNFESTIIVLCIVGSYLTFVLKIGPKIMEKRKAFKLTNILIVYNAIQVLYSCWILSHAVNVNVKYLFLGQTCDAHNYFSPSEKKKILNGLRYGSWWYFSAKIVEYLDTIFFTLRKKYDQVSFLHVYHHTAASLISWCYLKLLPGEQGAVLGLLNTGVHVVMYSYYLIAALGPKYRKYIWWKRYVTVMQLTQFVLMLIYLAFILATECPSTRLMTCLFTANITILLYLFSNFYRRKYLKKKET